MNSISSLAGPTGSESSNANEAVSAFSSRIVLAGSASPADDSTLQEEIASSAAFRTIHSVGCSTSMSIATLPEKVNLSRSGWSVSVYLLGLTSLGSMTAFDSVIVFLSSTPTSVFPGNIRKAPPIRHSREGGNPSPVTAVKPDVTWRSTFIPLCGP